ncbi:MAG TPA: hypothetical protein VGG71_10175, partial [Chitinophagaceae bacterium]
MDLKNKTLSEIAAIIDSDWSKQGKGVNYAALPYLNSMYSLKTINDVYGCDSAKSIIIYFLGNATSWKGETAKAV